MIKLRAPFNYDTDEASLESGLACEDPSLAQQQFKDESDINVIMERFNRTGEVIAPVRLPEFGDFTEVSDYHTALSRVREAQETFEGFPAHIRARFENDAGRFVEFVMDDANMEEALALGIVERPGHTDSLDVSVPTDTNKEATE